MRSNNPLVVSDRPASGSIRTTPQRKARPGSKRSRAPQGKRATISRGDITRGSEVMHSSLALPVGSLELIHGLALVDDDMIAVDPGDALTKRF